jgi:hypothetical protein
MLTIVHNSTFSADYRLYDGRDPVADLTLSRLRNAGGFTVEGQQYRFGPAPGWSWGSAPLILESDVRLVASVRCPVVFLRSSRPRGTMTYRHWECEFWQGRDVGTWYAPAHETDLRAGAVRLGSWTTDLEFRQEAAPPPEVTLAIKAFMAAWVLLDRRGQSAG